jgi:hypothetical protein
MPKSAGADVSTAGPEGEDDDELDLQQVKELLGFLVRAPRRRPRLAGIVLVAVVTLGVLLAIYWPRTYQCDVRLLAQRNLVLPALDNPTRAVPHEADAPTRNAADTILQRDNLIALVRQLDLVKRWETTRQPILRLKDRTLGAMSTRTDAERERDLVDFLLRKLTVVADESSITIALEWPDREMAFEIISFLQKNFLDARYDTSVNVITEAIRILEERAKPQAAEVDAALAELMKLEAERNQAALRAPAPAPPPGAPGGQVNAPAPRAPTAPGAAARPVPVDAEVAEELQDVRRRIRAMKDDRERQVAEAQRQLVDARATLGPLHPTVVALNEKLTQLAEVPADLKALDARERELVAQIAAGATAAAAPDPDAPAPAPPPTPSFPRYVAPSPAPAPAPTISPLPALLRSLTERDDPKTAHARQKLQTASTKYNEVLSRIEAANIELAVTRAAFKYQYSVVRPPELARNPSKPNVPAVLLATIALAVLLTILVPGLLDLSRGRLVEPWQVERALKLPVLGELSASPPSLGPASAREPGSS